jgi:CO/xanthine dehydrogenase FAD-binding subunit
MVYATPTRLDEALEIMQASPVIPLAGGTDFYPARVGSEPTDDVLDLSRVDELRGIEVDEETIRIGTLTTWTDIATASLPSGCRALQIAAAAVGGVQVQNVGTIGGNLCNASPAADGIPPLLVMDATVELASLTGTRRLALPEFVTGYRSTALLPGELLTAITLPRSSTGGTSTFLKLGSRSHLVISIVMVAARVTAEAGVLTSASVAVGACSPVARRLPGLEAKLTGRRIEEIDVGVDDLAGLEPIDDVRAPARYRLAAARVLAERALRQVAA